MLRAVLLLARRFELGACFVLYNTYSTANRSFLSPISGKIPVLEIPTFESLSTVFRSMDTAFYVFSLTRYFEKVSVSNITLTVSYELETRNRKL
jgi:hypothetical protein